MIEKTIAALEHTFKTLEKEMHDVFKKMSHTKGSKTTKIKIKAGSTVNINGAVCQLLDDTYVTTKEPDILMKRK